MPVLGIEQDEVRSAEHGSRPSAIEAAVNVIVTVGVFAGSWLLVVGAVILIYRLLS